MQAANENNCYGPDDAFGWCDCGCGTFWLHFDPASGAYVVICSQCDMDHTAQVCC